VALLAMIEEEKYFEDVVATMYTVNFAKKAVNIKLPPE
jgi:hypothetical protein